ncbi:trypco2 family protein [Streptomyces sp. NBC_01381]|uniref:trypco2 family protein n=1 Tax=Streptomyces sp. NBC_01381 TaxID=2903845 RepID=UPI003390370D
MAGDDSELLELGLAETVSALRRESSTAVAASINESISFGISSLDLEFEIEMEKRSTAKGDVRFWVVTAGADRSSTSHARHRVSMSLKPVQKNAGENNDVYIGHRLQEPPD